MPGAAERVRHFRFSGQADAALVTTLRDRLLQLEAVSRAELAGDVFEVQYRFPELGLAVVIAVLGDCGAALHPLDRLRLGLLAFMEANERDYLAGHYGWQRYVEDIYMHEYQAALNRKTDVRLQTWRKYKYN